MRSARSHIGQLWLKEPSKRTFFCTSGSSEKLTGCGPQPTFEIHPLGLMTSSAIFNVADTPAASTTPSTPRPSTVIAHSFGSPMMTSHPYFLATSKRALSRSKPTMATSAPPMRAIAAARIPIGPGPKTRMRSPGRRCPGAIVAEYATEHGSVIDA